MTQKAMGELFDVEQPAIAKHLINIYNEKELDKDSTYSKMELVQKEGNRLQEEYEEYQENEYKNAVKFINKMSKKELVEELIHVFDYAPEWVYDDFIKRNDIEG